jgi:pimeloyl-ACP methyl ester carboxylesterase
VIARRWRIIAVGLVLVLLSAWVLAVTQLPGAGAGALLHPARRAEVGARPAACRDVVVTSDGLQLKRWQCQAATLRRGSIVYLHGIADNRSSAAAVMERFTQSSSRRGSSSGHFRVAEQQGRFSVDDVSPVAAAAEIKIPVLLIHGADDSDTPPDHSRRILGALKGPKRLILVPGARHNQSLAGPVWNEVERWVDEILGPQ